ncbi:uncharacterized protein KY384_002640 [Bacidia gigantensis]|uniref:uncharacterized protein n=1 Tax=Bacidia gigantensis TaxID=2732470 RepID=UPI001D050D33|nr:uncharacterized protein KY384_002640 [Bacidia gigantensis]KAG8532762.1 hypothetical protein KY384_002640 [Bacidia gigantensis]
MAAAATAHIFASVFPPPSEVPIPTPTNTPLLPSSSTFGEVLPQRPSSSHDHPGPGVAEQIKWDRAWHVATLSLSLTDEPIDVCTSEGEESLKKKWWANVPDTETRRAVEYLLDKGKKLRKDEDLVRWFFEVQVVSHFIRVMRPLLGSMLDEKIKGRKTETMVEGLLDVGKGLYLCQAIYLYPVKRYMEKFLTAFHVQRLEKDLHGLFVQCLPKEQVEACLKQFLLHQASVVLVVDRARYAPRYTQQRSYDQDLTLKEKQKTLTWVKALQGVGLGGHQAQRVLGEVMIEILDSHVRTSLSRRWDSPSHSEQRLRHWVASDFTLFIVQILEAMHEAPSIDRSRQEQDVHVDVQKWQDMASRRLGALRADELYDVVLEWDSKMQGIIQDLKVYVKDSDSRAYLTTTFSNAISSKLLQPSSATSDILRVYISTIRVFTLLDPRGILLDRIARPIRRYLRERDDTVRIVVSGLLTDSTQGTNVDGALIELAFEMSKHDSHARPDEANADLDFDDMEWMPDPTDTGPEYKKPKHSDVIASLISLFESKDIFIKEFQNILGENLLKREQGFESEFRVLQLLKNRYGEAALQACEVMVRDIVDSIRLDAAIQKHSLLDSSGRFTGLRSHQAPSQLSPLHTRVLSHLYWPSLHSDSFNIPPEIEELQEEYAKGFEKFKTSRKLTWLNVLGQVTVTLDLEDRTVTEEVQTWQASVIYAFQPTDADDTSTPIIRSVADLIEKLSMPENLVLNALTFWVGKLVLKSLPTPPNPLRSYAVLETLANEAAAQEGTTSAAIAIAAETVTAAVAPAVLSEHEVAREKMGVYAQYVVGMLTNGGAMPLQQIITMLDMALPGGFPFGNEELKAFLEEEVREGRLDFGGGAYRIKR